MVEGGLMAGSSVLLVALTSGCQKVYFRTFNNYFDCVLTTRTTFVGSRSNLQAMFRTLWTDQIT